VGARVVFVGGERAERELVPAAGYEFHTLAVTQLARRDPVRAARAVVVAARAVMTARTLVGRLKPAAVVGAGGYVAGPIGVAAVTRRVPLVLMEADSHLGLTNRLLAPAARRVCLTFRPAAMGPATRHRAPGSGAGDRRCGAERFRSRPASKSSFAFGLPGARSINRAAVEAFDGGGFRAPHAATRDLPDLEAPGPHYDLRGYITDFGEALAADLRWRARAALSSEIAVHGPPDPHSVPLRRGRLPTVERALHGAPGSGCRHRRR
jgi:UDP-N-acetylglucosamine--N-acetylmuramyl-(pentapeptide) pyrophosphoryl-undecaprenol N-acetylglucosamine transferase